MKFNSAQVQSAIRSLLKVGGGALIAHGITQQSVTQWVIGIAPTVIGFLWSHIEHAAETPLTPPSTPSKPTT